MTELHAIASIPAVNVLEESSCVNRPFADLSAEQLVEVLRCCDFLTQKKIKQVSKRWKALLALPEVTESVFFDFPSLETIAGKPRLVADENEPKKWTPAGMCPEVRHVTFIGDLYYSDQLHHHRIALLFLLSRFFNMETLTLRRMWFRSTNPVDIAAIDMVFHSINCNSRARRPVTSSPWTGTPRACVSQTLLEAKCEFHLTILLPAQTDGRTGSQQRAPRSLERSWTVAVPTLTFMSEDTPDPLSKRFCWDPFTSWINRLWWPYPEAQTGWLIDRVEDLTKRSPAFVKFLDSEWVTNAEAHDIRRPPVIWIHYFHRRETILRSNPLFERKTKPGAEHVPDFLRNIHLFRLSEPGDSHRQDAKAHCFLAALVLEFEEPILHPPPYKFDFLEIRASVC
ncbi:hypothetical protein BV898_09005 [Hypsibius exemplaris]|uniref:F-box domain-containing protein n=1 Tax=Hypsibius exemplaris TaxID=2072580 RepID=A0A1W0WNY7_HYPEX|nr:hypothetical protein BV898_09005 [Hypsibius exemplaris]